MMSTRDFQSITILDRKGVVRVSSDQQAVGKPYASPPGAIPLGARKNGVEVRSFQSADVGTVLDFDAPITFQTKEIGRVHLGVLEAPLSKVAHLVIASMILLVVVTVASVAAATYWIADRYSKPLKLLAESMEEIGKGRYDYRIDEQRNDEFGQLYGTFDAMAQSLQRRSELAAPSAAATVQEPSS
jgi:serine/threonine-protein kinase